MLHKHVQCIIALQHNKNFYLYYAPFVILGTVIPSCLFTSSASAESV